MKALVVGYGHMGHIHAKVLADFGYEITTVDPAGHAGYSTITDAQMVDAQARGRGFDVAAIACPADKLVSAAFTLAGIPMLIEKPFASSLHDAEILADYLVMRGVPVCVGYVERFNPKVRWLKERIQGHEVTAAKFTRYSDRPSDSPVDLLSHDLDLARYLGLGPLRQAFEFDTRSNQPEKVRTIEVDLADGTRLWVDLMDHHVSPLHLLWQEFLTGGDYPTIQDALAVLRTFDMMQMAVAAQNGGL